MNQLHSLCSKRNGLLVASVVALTSFLGSQVAFAASSWSPTLLVNTEAFQTIDSGDGNSNIELRFGTAEDARVFFDITNHRFNFTRPVFIQGALTATGSITTKQDLSGATLHVEGAANVRGALTTSGSVRAGSTINAGTSITAGTSVTATTDLSGATLHIQGNANVRGTLSTSGAIKTDNDITINNDRGAGDATLNFGNATTNQTLKFLDTAQKFQLSKDLSVKGNLSGSTLTVDGGLTLRGVNYTAPGSQGGANTFLKDDGSGNLSWSSISVGNGSGGIMSLHPEYPNAVYFSSGSTIVGQLTNAYDSTNKENYYHWTSSQVALNDYWIAVRVRVPDNFSSWDPVKPIEVRYRSTSASAAVNFATIRVLDTAGANVALTGNSGLASTSWATASVKGPEAGGTFAAKGYFTVLIKLATTNAGSMDLGFLNFNWETTTP